MDKACFKQVAKIVAEYNLNGSVVVDVGSKDFNGSIKPVFKNSKYVGVDIQAGKNVDIVMTDGKTIPLENSCANVVTCLSVLEHCNHPFLLMSEMSRILKNDGVIIVCAPQKWGLHDYPHDYWRINPDGMRELFKVSGITPINIYTHNQYTIRHGVLKMTYGVGIKF